MKYATSKRGNYTILHFEEDIDASNSGEFKTVMESAVSGIEKEIILDFSKVNMLDSTSISIIITQYKNFKDKGGSFILAGCSGSIQNIFKIIGFKKFFRITSTLDEVFEGSN